MTIYREQEGALMTQEEVLAAEIIISINRGILEAIRKNDRSVVEAAKRYREEILEICNTHGIDLSSFGLAH